MMATAPKTILITGASAGLGAATADCLAAQGWLVYAGSRRNCLQANAHPSITSLKLDVTRPEDFESALRLILDREGKLDGILCNAGVNASAPLEEMPLAQARSLIETNFWGVVHGVQAVLPHFRARRAGTILAVGSLAGYVAAPGESYYAASKHALRGLFEGLHHEVAHLNVRVHLAEPGFIQTDLATASNVTTACHPDYNSVRENLAAHWRKAIAQGMKPDVAARRIAAILEDPHAPLYTRIGSDAVWIPRIKQLLPSRFFFAITRRKFGI